MNRKMSQTEMILRHLEDYETITTWEAIKEYGITRLSAKIFELRKKYIISGEWQHGTNRYGGPARWVEYKLEGIK